MGGQGRKTIITYNSPKRYRKRCGLPKPLPLGEVSPKVTERASPAGKSRCAAIGRLFVRAMLSLCKSCLSASLPSQSGLRPPAPPEGEPLACRSGSPSYNLSVSLRSTAPLVGEPLAKRRSFPLCQGLPSVGEVARRRRDGEVELLSQRESLCLRRLP